jgi:hypothetical protein
MVNILKMVDGSNIQSRLMDHYFQIHLQVSSKGVRGLKKTLWKRLKNKANPPKFKKGSMPLEERKSLHGNMLFEIL